MTSHLTDGNALTHTPQEPPIPAETEERRRPSTIGGVIYICILLVSVGGLAVVALDDWRTGIRIIGGALTAASAARLVLSPRDAGMLAVRRKALDITLLAGLGAALIFLATTIPDQPGL